MINEFKDIIKETEKILFNINKDKKIKYFNLSPFILIKKGLLLHLSSMWRYVYSFIILIYVVKLISPAFSDIVTQYNSFFNLFLIPVFITIIGIFTFFIPPSTYLFNSINEKKLYKIKHYIINKEQNISRKKINIFKEKMLRKKKKYRYILFILWGIVIFYYDKILILGKEKVSIDEFNLFIWLAIFFTIVIESYFKANILLFEYIKIAIIDLKKDN